MTSTASCPGPCHNRNALTWLLCPDIDHVSSALQIIVDLAQEDKGELVEKVLQHCKPELCIDALRKLLKSPASCFTAHSSAPVWFLILHHPSIFYFIFKTLQLIQVLQSGF